MIRKIFIHLFRLFFRLLYHEFAWAYDLVAWAVSFGNWQTWIKSTLPYMEAKEGKKTLELGFGPGHLQVELILSGLNTFGLDESLQMVKLAIRNINKNFRNNKEERFSKLVRGVTQSLPYKNGAFDCIIATFPTEYIFNNHTISEVARVLNPDGLFIILLSINISERNILKKGLALLYKITGQSAPLEINLSPYLDRLSANRFQVTTQWVDCKKDKLLILKAFKSSL
jgi:ubiquinone/menaquinone biosynthesis C-methylase UbiE